MALTADIKDYRRAFRKHYKAYCEWNKTGHHDSSIVILFYCVECGLKFLLMRELRILAIKDADEESGIILTSHRLEDLLKKLHMFQYPFPEITTNHNEKSRLMDYHQMRRYCIQPRKNHYKTMEEYDKELYRLAEEIAERGGL